MNEPRHLVTAFVGRSFAPEDKALWVEFREILESFQPLGFHFEDAEQAQPRPISQKVKEGIDRNQIYLGIVSRRRPLFPDPSGQDLAVKLKLLWGATQPTKEWTTSEWVIEEIGYALGRGRFALLLIESGVLFPKTDLDADTEYIPFDRLNVKACQIKLNQVLNRLIAEKFPQSAPAPAPASEPQPTATGAQPDDNAFRRLFDLAKQGKTDEADELQQRLIDEEEKEASKRASFTALLRRFRAVQGEQASFEWLKDHSSANPPDVDAILELAHLYGHWGQLAEASSLLEDAKKRVTPGKTAAITLAIARIERKLGKHDLVQDLLLTKLQTDSPTEASITLREFARLAKAKGDAELRLCALERAVHHDPLNSDVRFELAHLYADEGKHELAAFHYDLLGRASDENVAAINNLGVAYGDLEFPDKQVETLMRIEEDHALSKANLAHIYLRAGFITEAEKRAKGALDSSDSTAVERAQYALAQILEQRNKSAEFVEKIEGQTRPERTFRSNFMDSLLKSPPRSVTVTCAFPFGTMPIQATGSVLSGAVEEQYQTNRGLIAAAMLGQPTSPPIFATRTRRFAATLTGCAGTFASEVINGNGASSDERKGLIFVAEDMSEVSLLWKGDKQTEVWSARTQAAG